MPSDKSFRRVQGTPPPTQKPQEHDITSYPAPKMPAGPPSQARSPKPEHLGAAKGMPEGGTKVGEQVNRSSHSRAWGLKGS